MNKKNSIFNILEKNMVTLFFVILCVFAFLVSGMSFQHLLSEIFTRLGRNAFLVLALIIPVLTGMGLNFSIVLGAMAAQVALFIVLNNNWHGINGFLLCALIATPISILFGFLVGKLFNKMKGGEMIGGLVLGYFAEGLYQFLFLFILGGLVPIKNNALSISAGSAGVINSVDLTDKLKYTLDSIKLLTIVELIFYVVAAVSVISIVYNTFIKKKPVASSSSYIGALVLVSLIFGLSFVPAVETFLSSDRLVLLDAITFSVIILVAYQVIRIIIERVLKKSENVQPILKRIINIVIPIALYALTFIPEIEKAVLFVRIPVMTYMCFVGLYLFNGGIMKTKLGQNMRTVGHNKTVANSAGINVDQTRIIAMIISTVLASWGQLIFLQNLGTFSTYGAHVQVAQNAIASLLVGGASVRHANSKQAIIGVILFHTLVVLSPEAGKVLFGDPQIGEYFRVFVTYGVIAISLAMHAYNSIKKHKDNLSDNFGASDDEKKKAATV